MPDTKALDTNFAGMLRLFLNVDPMAGKRIEPRFFNPTKTGCEMRLPIRALKDTAAVVGSGDVGGRYVPDDYQISFLQGDSAGPVMARVRLLEVTHQRGKLATGDLLPATTMEGEFTSSASDSTPTLTTHEYMLDKVIESKSVTTFMATLQSSEDIAELLLRAHQLAIMDKLAEQIVAGDGANSNMLGVANVTGIDTATYLTLDRGDDAALLAGETAIEDAGARLPFMAWAVGSDLSDSLRSTLLEPGADRRVEENQRRTLSGTPIQRFTTGLDTTSAIIADWQTVIVPIASELEITINRVSRPGALTMTSRLPTASPIVSRPLAVRLLTQV